MSLIVTSNTGITLCAFPATLTAKSNYQNNFCLIFNMLLAESGKYSKRASEFCLPIIPLTSCNINLVVLYIANLPVRGWVRMYCNQSTLNCKYIRMILIFA